jgi:hypothetical protein
MELKMFVFEDVLWDYTSGMVLIAAEDLQEAQVIAFEEYNYRKDNLLADFLEQQSGFQEPSGVYPLASGANKGVLHSVHALLLIPWEFKMKVSILEMYEQARFLAGQENQFDTTNLHIAEKLVDMVVRDIMLVVSAHALSGDSAVDVFANLKRIYES